MTNPVIVLGGGGHAKVVADILQLLSVEVLGYVDPEVGVGQELLPGIKCVGGDDALSVYLPSTTDLVMGVGSLPGSPARANLFRKFVELGYHFRNIVHPQAIIAEQCTLGVGIQVMAGAIVQPGVRFLDDIIVNSGAIIEHDCRIGSHCHLAPGSTLCGSVVLEDCVYVGAGASVIQGLVVGSGSVVGAGSVLTKTLAPSHMVYPARPTIRAG